MNLSLILQRPIPDYTYARNTKKGYHTYPLDNNGERNGESLVDVADYGIAGQSYYSRQNAATGQPLPDVPATILLRQSVAEKIADINYELQRSDTVSELLGGKAELYLDEGVRSKSVQKKLYEEAFPALIRRQYPELSEQEVLKSRDTWISKPSSAVSPAPHATGAAMDIKLRFVQEETGFIAKGFVDMGHKRGELNASTEPDYYEHLGTLAKSQEAARTNRRVFYWVMRGALLGDDSGFEVDPNEWWHWSYGDQMWALTRRAPYAFFGLVPE